MLYTISFQPFTWVLPVKKLPLPLFLHIGLIQAWEFSENFQISQRFGLHSTNFQDVLSHFCQFLHIFRKYPKDSFSCLLIISPSHPVHHTSMLLYLLPYFSYSFRCCQISSFFTWDSSSLYLRYIWLVIFTNHILPINSFFIFQTGLLTT